LHFSVLITHQQLLDIDVYDVTKTSGKIAFLMEEIEICFIIRLACISVSILMLTPILRVAITGSSNF